MARVLLVALFAGLTLASAENQDVLLDKRLLGLLGADKGGGEGLLGGLIGGDGLLGGLIPIGGGGGLLGGLLGGKGGLLGGLTGKGGPLEAVGKLIQSLVDILQQLANALQGIEPTDADAVKEHLDKLPTNQVCPYCDKIPDKPQETACTDYCIKVKKWKYPPKTATNA